MRFLIAPLFAAHGAVHLLYLGRRPKSDPRYPFAPETAWSARALALEPATAKTIGAALGIASCVSLVAAGAALLVDLQIWEPLALVGAGISLALLVLFFHPWLVLGVAIDVAIIASVGWVHTPASLFH